MNARFLDKSFGLVRKVYTPGGREYLLNLDDVKQAVEAEDDDSEDCNAQCLIFWTASG